MSMLNQVFAIDVCAYAITSNYYHLVLHINTFSAESWSDEEVVCVGISYTNHIYLRVIGSVMS